MSIQRICQLDEKVSNRIAAGEVIQRPGNAVKELLENSLDSKAKNIQILIQEGGIKKIQIQDDGCGIEKDDFYLVCKKYTTSKIRNFDDLKEIATFGFRGEALASISNVSKVSIISKTASSNCAYRADYLDGDLIPHKTGAPALPQPSAGNNGTTIIVEDLFFNYPMRRKVLKNANEEYSVILDIVNRYAVHSNGIGFSCKRSTSNLPDLQISPNSTKVARINQIYGKDISSDLVEIQEKNETLQYDCSGYITQTKYKGKKLWFLLFINNRSVMWNSLKKVITELYTPLLMKGNFPFIYLSINLPANHVDVNIHPTKKEVHFLNEDEILYSITSMIRTKLEMSGSSRTFQTNVIVDNSRIFNIKESKSDILFKIKESDDIDFKPKSELPPLNKDNSNHQTNTSIQSTNDISFQSTSNQNLQSSNISTVLGDTFQSSDNTFHLNNTSFSSNRIIPTKRRDYQLVRTDKSIQNLGSYYPTMSKNYVPNKSVQLNVLSMLDNNNKLDENYENMNLNIKKRKRIEVKLESVLNLIKEVKVNCDFGLKNILSKHTFVGCLDSKLACIQSDTGLYLINYSIMSYDLMYQRTLIDFCNFSTIQVTPPMSIYEMIKLGLNSKIQWPKLYNEIEISDDPAKAIVNMLIEKSEMLEEYFQISIDSKGYLNQLPTLIPKYMPPLYKIPAFFIRLGTEIVNWEDEKECFDTFSKELARLYRFDLPSNETSKTILDHYFWQVEHILLPNLRSDFFPPKGWIVNENDKSGNLVIRAMADLHDLYKIFERC